MIVLLEGPNKAGKSTSAKYIQAALLNRGIHCSIRKWGPVGTHEVYADAITEDSLKSEVVLWDRGWPSETIYSTMLKRPNDPASKFWLCEWLYTRKLLAYGGMSVFIMPIYAESWFKNQDSTDQAFVTTPREEYDLYEKYLNTFGGNRITIDHLKSVTDVTHTQQLDDFVEDIVFQMRRKYVEGDRLFKSHFADLWHCTGNPYGDVLIINENDFNPKITPALHRIDSTAVNRTFFAKYGKMNPVMINSFQAVIVDGKYAARWVKSSTNIEIPMYNVVTSRLSPQFQYICSQIYGKSYDKSNVGY